MAKLIVTAQLNPTGVEALNHRYDTSGKALNPGSVASYGVLYLPPSAGLFD